jgi:hypothetical protein
MSNSDDPFAVLAAEQISAPVKARQRAVQTRAERRQAKAQSDKEVLAASWRYWHDKQVKALQSGHYGEHAATVTGFLEIMTLEDGNRLVELIEQGPWREADAESKYLLLGLIGRRITYLRQAEGWPVFDDSIPFSAEEPTAFETIRKVLQT